jgi:hypothetical protein
MAAGVGVMLGLTYLVGGVALGRDVGYGMLGPLVAAIGTWVVIERTAATNLSRLNQRLMQGFAVKAVFFAAYVTLGLRVVHATPIPFVVGFTTCFIVLHATEAWLLQRLTARHLASVSRT